MIINPKYINIFFLSCIIISSLLWWEGPTTSQKLLPKKLKLDVLQEAVKRGINMFPLDFLDDC